MFFEKDIAILLIEGAARHIGDTIDDTISHEEIRLAYDFATFTYLRDEALDNLRQLQSKKKVA